MTILLADHHDLVRCETELHAIGLRLGEHNVCWGIKLFEAEALIMEVIREARAEAEFACGAPLPEWMEETRT